MDKCAASSFARSAMSKHGLSDWTLIWNRSKRTAGECSSYFKEIKLSTVGLVNFTEEEFKDTVLHEIAHALVGTHEDHNSVWKAKCIEIGGTGEVYAKQFSPYRWVLMCSNGHILKKWHRKPSSDWDYSTCLMCKRRGDRAHAWIRSVEDAERMLGKKLQWGENVAALRTNR